MKNNQPQNTNLIQTRKATIDDIDQLVNLLEELFALEDDYVFDREKQTKGLQMLLNSGTGCIFTAESAGEVVGMCSIQTVISTAQGALSGWVEDVIISTKHRGKGIGTKLLTFAQDWAKENGITRLQLLADTDNSQALAFYLKDNWQKMHSVALRKYLK
ncbi:MAG: GNAT family N-acetyltransferase [Sedimentisphaerales bacterium]|nr:GNAT family N-acetyltransferase [Sedimentisphaerales bacterium]